MRDPSDATASSAPSRRTLIKGAAWTFVAAVVVTVLFILPAEFGVDPTGLGDKIGLKAMSRAGAPRINTAPRVVTGSFPDIPPEEEFDYFEPEVLGDPYSRNHVSVFRTDTFEIDLDVYEQVEYKAVMQQGDALVYSWKLTKGETVYTDFHADPAGDPAYPELYWIRYAESEESSGAGSLVAPFAGNHGWYWLNIEEEPVKITLEVRGFYTDFGEIMRSYQ
jgi:hypothetical protein